MYEIPEPSRYIPIAGPILAPKPMLPTLPFLGTDLHIANILVSTRSILFANFRSMPPRIQIGNSGLELVA